MMQRVLHIGTDTFCNADMINGLFDTKDSVCIGSVTAVSVECDNFCEFNEKILDVILNTSVKKFVLHYLYKNMKYLNIQEQKKIFDDVCSGICREHYVNIISHYVAAHTIINPRGLYDFVLGDLREETELLCCEKANEYAFRNEYLDFIRMLRFFADINFGRIKLVHVVMTGSMTADLYDEEYAVLETCAGAGEEFACLSELVEYDNIISTLVESSPEKIVIHNARKYDTEDVCETLLNIFDKRIIFCTGCNLCNE